MAELPEQDPELEEGDEAFVLQPTNGWGLAVIGLSLFARVTEDIAETVQDFAKFWCELAMAAAGQSNHDRNQKEFEVAAVRDIERIVNGDASSESTGRG